jgi:hypothetical protein
MHYQVGKSGKACMFCLLVLVVMPLSAQSLDPIQESHIAGNVPPASKFPEYLRRDLMSYFRTAGFGDATEVQYELLRDAPTQSGVSYPKYYVWVRIIEHGAIREQGAARVAAIDGTRFEVTTFLSSKNLTRDSALTVFPEALVDGILSRAAAH